MTKTMKLREAIEINKNLEDFSKKLISLPYDTARAISQNYTAIKDVVSKHIQPTTELSDEELDKDIEVEVVGVKPEGLENNLWDIATLVNLEFMMES